MTTWTMATRGVQAGERGADSYCGAAARSGAKACHRPAVGGPACRLGGLLACLFAGLAAAGLRAEAAPETGPELSGAITWASDYRFRGLSLNGKDFALQGEIGASWQGWHVSGWASSQRAVPGADVETDVTVGRGFAALGLDWDLGGIVYLFPGSRGSVYGELYAAAGSSRGPLSWTGRVHYVPPQPNSGDRDNLYLAADLDLALLDAGAGVFALNWTGHAGYEDGAFARNKWDVETGFVARCRALLFAVTYVATVNGGAPGDDAVLLRLGARF